MGQQMISIIDSFNVSLQGDAPLDLYLVWYTFVISHRYTLHVFS